MMLVLLFLDRFTIDKKDWFYCSADNTFLIYVDKNGGFYVMLLCLQFLFVANMIKVVLYEGAFKSRMFGESTPADGSYCLQICFCNGWTIEEELSTELPKRDDDESERRTPNDMSLEMAAD